MILKNKADSNFKTIPSSTAVNPFIQYSSTYLLICYAETKISKRSHIYFGGHVWRQRFLEWWPQHEDHTRFLFIFYNSVIHLQSMVPKMFMHSWYPSKRPFFKIRINYNRKVFTVDDQLQNIFFLHICFHKFRTPSTILFFV